ncbi:MAG: ribosome small subunit-dependent GTPase A [Peptococcaceae bacterium]|nr:ribosome small subunit-dependent GTPase A [Peptococcaceae bacterium]
MKGYGGFYYVTAAAGGDAEGRDADKHSVGDRAGGVAGGSDGVRGIEGDASADSDYDSAGAVTEAGAEGRDASDSPSELWECRPRGRLRREKQDILAGDRVAFAIVNSERREGVIEAILPRRNRLIRPPVANVDQALVVLAAGDPPPDLWLLDKLLIMIRTAGIAPLLCWNKEDLAERGDLAELTAPYQAAGLAQVITCALSGQGISELRERLAGQATVLAGPSGVGKSSLLNQIRPGLALKTGDVSEKLGRGRHTTRHVEWIPLAGGGWVADTPGFSRIDLPAAVKREDLAAFYPEFAAWAEDCPFASCSHDKERDCGVRQAAAAGKLDEGRYRRYVSFLREIEGEYGHGHD